MREICVMRKVIDFFVYGGWWGVCDCEMLEQRYRWRVNREDEVKRVTARDTVVVSTYPSQGSGRRLRWTQTQRQGHICLPAPQPPSARRAFLAAAGTAHLCCAPDHLVVAEAESFGINAR